MESVKYRHVISGRSIAQFLPMLDNNSRNILASEKLKGDRNLRVTWLFFSANDEICRLVEIDPINDKVKNCAFWTIMWTNPLGPQVHVAIHKYSESENGVGPDEGRRGGVSNIEEKWKKRVRARKHVATWIGTWVQSCFVYRNLSPGEFTYTLVRSC